MSAERNIYLSFFMFTTNLRPGDAEYTKVIVRHMKELQQLGYTGFDMPIFPDDTRDHRAEVESYVQLKRELDRAGLDGLGFTTNVAATRTFNPTSVYADERAVGLAYLKSRVDITAALGGTILGGPIVFPYNLFPTTDANEPIWSDALQTWVQPRYRDAQPVLNELGEYAAEKNVKLAIEPVDHWETPAPNMIGDVLEFLADVPSRQVGVCVDSAHVVLGSSGPEAFQQEIREIAQAGRLNYVQVSAPDRGAVRDSWIPWDTFLRAVLPRYEGPLLIEVFNAIPAFLESLHLTRRKFWIPGEDEPVAGCPDAYTVAGQAIEELEKQLSTYTERHCDDR
ncbi:MAG TPA: sugar phosphate isomerase/epimerase family protein [Kineosporiaceae bacterium]|nr:sugar phosphate isomerase/epimerase family protein [Kineosporiaceae bacterium]